MIEQEIGRKLADFRELGFPDYIPREGRVHRVRNMVSVLIGARRVGKSFQAMQFAEELIQEGFIPDRAHVCHLDFDNPILAQMRAEQLPSIQRIFFQQNPSFHLKTPIVYIFDELHRVQGWEDYAIELSRNPHWQVIVTGSSARLLSTEIATSLRGKAISTTITPLSFREFLSFKKIDPLGQTTRQTAALHLAFEEYLRWGSFPVISQVAEFTRPTLLREYYDTMLLRDIIQRNEIHCVDDCIALYAYLLSCMAKPFTIKSAQSCLTGAGFNTGREAISRYIRYAEDAWLFQTVPLYTDSIKQVSRNYRKVYAVDWAFANYNSPTWDGSFSRALENLVFVELSRRYPRVCYGLAFSTRQEVDFIVDDSHGKPCLAVQVCQDISDPDTFMREITPLIAVTQYYRLPESLILTVGNEERNIQRDGVNVHICPVWKWLIGEPNPPRGSL
jgi:predicted AAA+ superfamily ATPase